MGIHVRVRGRVDQWYGGEIRKSLFTSAPIYGIQGNLFHERGKFQMRPTLRSPMLFWLGIGLAVALSGCESRDESAAPGQIRQIRSDLVPIVRDLPLVAMKEPLVVEFDVSPPGRNSTHTLVLGIRVSGKNGQPSFEARDDVIASNIKAIVTLEGPTIGSGRQFPLIRTVQSATTDVPNVDVRIGTDGKTEGTWPADVDDTSLVEAALTKPGSDYRYLAFASARGIPPGRYRLTIMLTHTDTDVSHVASELVLAYSHKPK